MSYVKIWIHLVFSTKNRDPLLPKEVRQELLQHITASCKEKNIFMKAINGHDDHIHCLVSLGKDQSIASIAHLIKGESSFWLNKNQLVNGKFAWQDDYFAVSVSESQLETITTYITNQERHHAKKSFTMEVEEFMNKYGFNNL